MNQHPKRSALLYHTLRGKWLSCGPSNREYENRDEGGKFAEKVTKQDILKVFDASNEPVLSATEIADKIEKEVTRQTITRRLNEMKDEGLVDKKEIGARAVAWWATVAPRLSEETHRNIEATEGELERGETVSQDDLKAHLGIDG